MQLIKKEDWIKYFPFKVPRDEQIESINFILNKFESKRFVILEAPIGIGKSAIAVTLSKYYNEKIKNDKKTSYIVTTQKILQEQYMRDFPSIASITAKQNYQCIHKPIGITCDMGLTMAKILATKSVPFKAYLPTCVYKIDKDKFDNSNISLTNLPFFLNHAGADLKERNILIVDECHNIENAITSFAAMTFTKYFVQETLKMEWPNAKYMTIEKFIDWVKTRYSVKLSDEFLVLEGKLNGIASQSYLESKSGMGILRKIDEYKRKMEQLSEGLKIFKKDEWVMTVSPTEDTVSLQPIFADKYTQKMLFHMGNKVLLMSGTILDKNTFCKNVGIDANDAAFLSLDSPFPVENRPIYEMMIGSMSKYNIDKTLPAMVSAIKEILKHHKDDKGIIHCHNYKIAKYISDNINNDRLLFHSSDDRIDTLNFHITTKEPTVLVSPSFTEGIDLVGELSRFQIIAKVPFPFLGDNYVKTKMERVKGWYEWQTLKTIIQGSGRSIRDYDDYAVTYILDSDWNFVKAKNSHMIPKWFKKALQK